MQVHFVGSGGRRQTCIRLAAPGTTVLVDCGATSLAALKAQGVDPGSVDAAVVTHLHGDQRGGIPFLILDGQFSRRTTPLLVAGPPGTRARLEQAMETLFPGSSQVRRRFPVEVRELTPDGRPADLGPATVSAWEVVHASGTPPPALQVRLDGRRPGRPDGRRLHRCAGSCAVRTVGSVTPALRLTTRAYVDFCHVSTCACR